MNFLRNSIIFLLVIAVTMTAMMVWGLYQYTQLKRTEISLAAWRVPEAFRGKKIVFVADFQYDTKAFGINREMLQKTVDMINAEAPDIILLGGDYINYAQFIDETFAVLGQLQAPLGVYAVTGNHDYADIEHVYAAFAEYGIACLDNTGVWLEQGEARLRIGGVEDWYYGEPDADWAIGDAKADDFVMMMSHNSDYFEQLNASQHRLVDVTLSGHLHAGQVTAFGLFAPVIPSRYGDKYLYGMKQFEGNSIYITSGVGGTVGPLPLRFFAQPEIVVLVL